MKRTGIIVVAALVVTMGLATTARAAELELYHADFHARLGMRLHAQVGQVAADVSMKAVLVGGKRPAKTVFEKSGKLDPQETVTLDLRELAAGEYTLTVSLSDGRTASRTWTKPYDGVPAVGLDENYAICVAGKPFFPVMCKGVSDEKDVQKWLPYVNSMKHIGFNEKLYPPEGFKAWLDLAQKYGLKAVGPGRGLYWPNGGGIHKSKTQRDRRTIPEKQEPYIKIARKHPAFLMYEWKDEPELDNADNCIFPEEVRRWVDQCHELDKQHLVFCTFAGYGFARPEDNWMHQHVRSFTYLYGKLPVGKRLFTDVFSTDYYPIENAHDKFGVSIEGMCTAMDNIRKYNANLVPLIACVETCDIEKPDTPAPTPEEVTVLCWANIIHGAKGISWFH
ncbi:MAG: hypothetical protein JXL80_06745, partial [Planctomycetes bacterium]|nr:hypothetical protein [Planctomycetota bacterium]